MQRLAKTNDKNRRFGVIMTPLSIVIYANLMLHFATNFIFYFSLTMASWWHRNVGFYR